MDQNKKAEVKSSSMSIKELTETIAKLSRTTVQLSATIKKRQETRLNGYKNKKKIRK